MATRRGYVRRGRLATGVHHAITYARSDTSMTGDTITACGARVEATGS
jgi:hypothetical protein